MLFLKADMGAPKGSLVRSGVDGALSLISGSWPMLLGCTCAATVAGLMVRSKLLEPIVDWDAQQRSIASSGSDAPEKKRSFARKAVPDNVDAIVIGSGPGGLACAVTLTKQGKRVVVLEQHDVIGGCTHTFTEGGYEFDSGLHYIGGEIWDPTKGGRVLMDFVTDGAVKWQRTGEVCDVSVIGGKRIDMRAGLEKLKADLKEFFPDEEQAIERYFEAVFDCQSMSGLFFAHKCLPDWVQRPLEKVMRRDYLSRYATKTTLEILQETGASKELISRLTFHWGDIGLPPGKSSFALHAMVAQHYFNGGAYPIGGPSTIPRAACRIIEQHGGFVFARAPVEQVLIGDEGQVRGVRVAKSGGVDILAPVVVSAVGATATYTRLLPEHMRPPALVKEVQGPAMGQSCAHLSLFIGLKGDNDELQLPASNMWVSPSVDHDANTEAWYSLEPTEEALESGEFAAVFVTFPSAKDPSWSARHPGKSTCHMIAEAPYRWFAEFRDARLHHRGEKYEALKRVLTRKLLAVLFEQFPQCEGRIDLCELGTPVTSEHFLGSPQGASYGLAGTPERFAAEWLQPKTPVRGLYLTGQDVVSSGVMGALCAGFLAALVVDTRIAWSRLRIVTSL